MLKRTLYASNFINKMKRVDQGMSLAPRAGVDFELESPDQIIPGAHPLPLRQSQIASLRWPLVSPFMPSPNRVHPYFQSAIPELPNLECTVPIIYTHRCIKVPIIVPVFSTTTYEVTHTRTLDPYIFGRYPLQRSLWWGYDYWQRRCQDFGTQNDPNKREVYKSNKKDWPNAGSGLKRAGNRRGHRWSWGSPTFTTKPWHRFMPRQEPHKWLEGNCMAISTKMLQGKLQVVDKLTLPEPSTDAFRDLCTKMGWDIRHTGAGVLFIDGGPRLMPSKNFDRNFFYGSFVDGRVKVVRPLLECDPAIDWNRFNNRLNYLGPRGPKNPVPLNRFNVFDCFEHERLVITEGAIEQMQSEVLSTKYYDLPPHVRNQLPDRGAFEMRGVLSLEDEVAGRMEEAEIPLYESYYDNPYEPWKDEAEASYEVDEVEARIRRHTTLRHKDSAVLPGSWKLLD